jgi:hypothetical protein
MIVKSLEYLCETLEAANLSWGDYVMDGGEASRQIKFGLVDADEWREKGLMVGIDFRSPVTRPRFGSLVLEGLEGVAVRAQPRVVAYDEIAGTVQLEQGFEYAARLLNIHVYMRETRPDHKRTDYSLTTAYLSNEAKLLRTLGMGRKEHSLTVGGTPRGITTSYEGNPYVLEGGMTLHSVFQYRLVYPQISEEPNIVQAFLAKRVRLAHDLALEQLDQVDLDTTPLTVPPVGRVTTVQ